MITNIKRNNLFFCSFCIFIWFVDNSNVSINFNDDNYQTFQANVRQPILFQNFTLDPSLQSNLNYEKDFNFEFPTFNDDISFDNLDSAIATSPFLFSTFGMNFQHNNNGISNLNGQITGQASMNGSFMNGHQIPQVAQYQQPIMVRSPQSSLPQSSLPHFNPFAISTNQNNIQNNNMSMALEFSHPQPITIQSSQPPSFPNHNNDNTNNMSTGLGVSNIPEIENKNENNNALLSLL